MSVEAKKLMILAATLCIAFGCVFWTVAFFLLVYAAVNKTA
jgi:type IV secretory pathway TrbD component